MRTSWILLGALVAMFAGTGSARANRPADGGGGGSRVHTKKPWRASYHYLVQGTFALRVDPSLEAPANGTQIQAGTWLPIACQSYAPTSAGRVLWDGVAGGFVPDSDLKTYTDGRLAGAPQCVFPHPNRVYSRRPWTKGSFYRVEVSQVTQKKPNLRHGTGDVRHAGDWVHITCHTTGQSVHGSTVWDRLSSGAFFPDADLKTYYDVPVPGAPACAKHVAPPKKPVYMALGDSYSSGLGADFVVQADGSFTSDGSGYYPNPAGRKKACDRSPEAYSRYLATSIRQPMSHSPASTFLACQGDTTKEVLALQIPRIPSNTGLVTMTVMGNDMGFSSVITTCAGNGDCGASIRSHFGRHNSILKQRIHRLDRVLVAIRKRARHATIVVGGYPRLFDPPNKDLTACKFINTDEQALLNKAGDALDNAIRGATRRHGGVIFADPRPWFVGHGPCIDGGPGQWINAIDLKPHSLSAEPWSMHPNHAGHEIYASVFTKAAPSVFR